MTKVLLPGHVLRHVADVGTPIRYQGGTWYPLTRLCDEETKIAGAQFIPSWAAVASFTVAS